MKPSERAELEEAFPSFQFGGPEPSSEDVEFREQYGVWPWTMEGIPRDPDFMGDALSDAELHASREDAAAWEAERKERLGKAEEVFRARRPETQRSFREDLGRVSRDLWLEARFPDGERSGLAAERMTSEETQWEEAASGAVLGVREHLHAKEHGGFPQAEAPTKEERGFLEDTGLFPTEREWWLRSEAGSWPGVEMTPEERKFLERHGVHPGNQDYAFRSVAGSFADVPLGSREESQERQGRLFRWALKNKELPEMDFGEARDVAESVSEKSSRARDGAGIGD